MMNFIFFILVIFINAINAREAYNYTQSTQGILMGGAYSTLADKEYTVFYNPAMLARHRGFSFYPLNPSISLTNPLNSGVSADDLDGNLTDVASNTMGSPIHSGLSYTPGFKMGNVGFSAIVNQRTNLTLRNKSSPLLDIDYIYDRGFILGYGHSINGKYSSDKGGEHLALGMSIKYIDREEIRGNYNLFSPALYDAFESGELGNILDALGVVESSGWGIDTGIDYIKRSGKSEVSLGLSLIDTLTILHPKDEGEQVGETNLKVNLSGSWKMILKNDIGLVLSGEMVDIAKQGALSKKYRLGVELRFTPILSFYGGVNSGQYSYGFGLNGGLFKLHAGMYSLDTGVEYGQEVSNRAIIYLSLLDFKFDG